VSRIFNLKMARQTAEAFLKREGITKLPVDPFEIARNLDIVVEGKSDNVAGVSGMLLRHGNEFGIIYATHIPNPGFHRFSVGHEIGHYMLPGHPDHVLKDGAHISRAGFVTNDVYELEADHFAAGLLMPEDPFRREMDRHDAGLDAVLSMADLCLTSRVATAIRFAEVSSVAIATIVSTNGIIDYCFLSEAMKSLPKLDWVRKGTPLPAGSVTGKLAADPTSVGSGVRISDEVDVRDWLGGTTASTVSEESIGLGSYGKVLTILVSNEIGKETDPDDPDDENEEAMIDRWTPKFRR
jgi:Zn-dependent peptidase ImmA (M78 family)